jgi:hypothetical protein
MYLNGLCPLQNIESIGKVCEKTKLQTKKTSTIQRIGDMQGLVNLGCKGGTLATRYEFILKYLEYVDQALKILLSSGMPEHTLKKYTEALKQPDFQRFEKMVKKTADNEMKKNETKHGKKEDFKQAYDFNLNLPDKLKKARDIAYKKLLSTNKSKSIKDDARIADTILFNVANDNLSLRVSSNIADAFSAYESFKKKVKISENLDILTRAFSDSSSHGMFVYTPSNVWSIEEINQLEKLQIEILREAPPEIKNENQYTEYYKKPLDRYLFLPKTLPWENVDYDFLKNALTLQKKLIDEKDDAGISRWSNLLANARTLENIKTLQTAMSSELQ